MIISEAKLQITSSVKAALAELYFKEECSQTRWAYSSLERIHKVGSARFKDDGILQFRAGVEDVDVRILHGIIPEVLEICKPAAGESYVFSYLAYNIGRDFQRAGPVVANPAGLSWVHVKKGAGLFSDAQLDTLQKIRLPLTIFSVKDLLAAPRNLQVRWDTRSSGKWLDMLEELKEQEEYDDEYF
jgi:hypothetical protein